MLVVGGFEMRFKEQYKITLYAAGTVIFTVNTFVLLGLLSFLITAKIYGVGHICTPCLVVQSTIFLCLGTILFWYRNIVLEHDECAKDAKKDTLTVNAKSYKSMPKASGVSQADEDDD